MRDVFGLHLSRRSGTSLPRGALRLHVRWWLLLAKNEARNDPGCLAFGHAAWTSIRLRPNTICPVPDLGCRGSPQERGIDSAFSALPKPSRRFFPHPRSRPLQESTGRARPVQTQGTWGALGDTDGAGLLALGQRNNQNEKTSSLSTI